MSGFSSFCFLPARVPFKPLISLALLHMMITEVDAADMSASPSNSPSPLPIGGFSHLPKIITVLTPLFFILAIACIAGVFYREKLVECCQESFAIGRYLCLKLSQRRSRGDWPEPTQYQSLNGLDEACEG